MENLIIIGGGPAGLSAAIYAARASLEPLVIEGTVPGGQLTLTSEVENYPGFPNGILGIELVDNFRKQAEKFGTRFITDQVVSIISKSKFSISKKAPNPNPSTSSGQVFQIKLTKQIIEARAVLIAVGANALWLGLEAETRLRGKGVSACATCDGFFYRGKTVAVIGGGDTAMEEANVLSKFASKVYLIHRRAEFRASKIMQERVLNNPKVEVIYNSQVVDIIGDEKVESIKISDVEANLASRSEHESPLQILPVQGIFVAIGHKPATDFLKDSGVLVDKKGYVYTSNRMAYESSKFKVQSLNQSSDQNPIDFSAELKRFDLDYQYGTSLPGIFAAGDCVDHLYRQAATAVGMGVSAELEIEKFLEK